MNMIRGRIMERAVQHQLQGKIPKGQMEKFVKDWLFKESAFLDTTQEDKEKELDHLLGNKKTKGMINNCLEAIEELQLTNIKYQTKYLTRLKKTNTDIKGITDAEGYSEKFKEEILVDFKAAKQIRQIEIDNKIQGGVYHKFTGKRIFFIKCSKARYEIQELSKEDIYIGLETAVHVLNIIENVCENFETLEDYYKVIYPFKKYDRSDLMEKEIKKQYRKLFNTNDEYKKAIHI